MPRSLNINTPNQIKVTDFGASPIATAAENSAAFAEAFVSLGVVGGTVRVPAGNYLIDAVTGSIRPTSNTELLFDPGAILTVEPNSEVQYHAIFIGDVQNVRISGGEIVGDWDTHIYAYDPAHPWDGGQWGRGIGIFGGQDITIEDGYIHDCWGDGISTGISWTTPGRQVERVRISHTRLHHNRRNNISPCNCLGFIMEDCLLTSAGGGSRPLPGPGAGIDIEPDSTDEWVQDVRIERCRITNNAGYGISLFPQPQAVIGPTWENYKNVQILNNYIVDNGDTNGMWMTQLFIRGYSYGELLIEGNYIENLGNITSFVMYFNKTFNARIINNHINGGVSCALIFDNGWQNVVEGNIIENAGAIGLWVSGYDNTIIGNHFRANGRLGNPSHSEHIWFQVLATSVRNLVSNNVFKKDDGGTYPKYVAWNRGPANVFSSNYAGVGYTQQFILNDPGITPVFLGGNVMGLGTVTEQMQDLAASEGISLVGAYRSDNASVVAVGNGNPVATWPNDLDGTGATDFTAAAGEQPLFEDTVAGWNMGGLLFDGVDDKMTSTIGALFAGSDVPFTVVIAYEQTGEPCTSQRIWSMGNSASANTFHEFTAFDPDTGYVDFTKFGRNSFSRMDDVASPYVSVIGGQSMVSRSVSALSFAGTTWTGRYNDVDEFTGAAANVGTCTFTRMTLGAMFRGAVTVANHLKGRIGAVYVFSGALSTAGTTVAKAILSQDYLYADGYTWADLTVTQKLERFGAAQGATMIGAFRSDDPVVTGVGVGNPVPTVPNAKDIGVSDFTATGTARPTLEAGGTRWAKPSLGFDGAANLMSSPLGSSLSGTKTPFTMLAAYQTTTTSCRVWSTGSSADADPFYEYIVYSATKNEVDAMDNVADPYTWKAGASSTTNKSISCFCVRGTNWSSTYNGVTEYENTPPNHAIGLQTFTRLTIGGLWRGAATKGQYMTGGLGALYLFNYYLSEQARKYMSYILAEDYPY